MKSKNPRDAILVDIISMRDGKDMPMNVKSARPFMKKPMPAAAQAEEAGIPEGYERDPETGKLRKKKKKSELDDLLDMNESADRPASINGSY